MIDWLVMVGLGAYEPPETEGPLLVERLVVQVRVIAATRVEAELVATQVAAIHGQPLWALTRYDW